VPTLDPRFPFFNRRRFPCLNTLGNIATSFYFPPVPRNIFQKKTISCQVVEIRKFAYVLSERRNNMTVQQIEKQVLKLDANSRAKLASKLLSNLDELSDAENEKLWAEEAVHRHNELSRGKAKFKSAEVVFKNAQKK
jgi:hypothetical protein